ncbi:MAG: alpha-amylase, partial [Muribaculaceae bacterium]|nr:alpha-amylase [Muribaculaceae bacterium]
MKRILTSVTLGLALLANVRGADYGLPANIQDGNILHCFNWTAAEIKSELPAIAAAGFGTVQMSPLQRPDIRVGSSWHDLYRPYDLAFKSSSFCSEKDLKDLCTEAEKYGIKVIVDVVANHVDKTAGFHDTWWDSNGRIRWNGGIDYNNRYSVTHGQLGDYGDVNSESAEVASRGKAYVEKLKSLGVKGCRWDAAKHIGLPSEGCNFWSVVTSVPDMYHYGEILDEPVSGNGSLIKEYVKYMSVTDNKYCNYAARDNGGIPGGYGGAWAVDQGVPANKLVYWGESHDTYSNDEWSQRVSQDVIDRAYAAYATREGTTALYLARPNAVGFGNIKVGKGSTAYKNKHIAEVNKFRNIMVGKKDWFESNGNACSITRQNGGAVVVAKGSGNVTVANGGGYCPTGTYTDRISGNKFTVTASTISGNVGNSGIAVLYN